METSAYATPPPPDISPPPLHERDPVSPVSAGLTPSVAIHELDIPPGGLSLSRARLHSDLSLCSCFPPPKPDPVSASDPADPSPTCQLMYRVVFALRPGGTASPFRKEDRVVLARFPYTVVDPETRPTLRKKCGSVNILFPKSFYDPDLPFPQLQRRYHQYSAGSGASQTPDPSGLADEDDPCDFVYSTFETETVLGCRHYASHFRFHCKRCAKEGKPADFVCKRCHDDATDTHLLSHDDIAHVTCTRCGCEAKFDSNFRGCPNCDSGEAKPYTCGECLIISDSVCPNNPVYHCEDCGRCIKGDRACTTHCKACGRCYNFLDAATHTCIKDLGNCIFCLDDLWLGNAPYHLLGCGFHYAHDHCLSSYLHSGGPVGCSARTETCPICKRELFASGDPLRDSPRSERAAPPCPSTKRAPASVQDITQG